MVQNELTCTDIAREGQIRRLANQLKLAHFLGNSNDQHRLWSLMRERVLARSAAQVAHMERAGGLQS
ncbi:MAG TPA: hypothetical protein VGC74_04065 [Stenotrophomonas sp.]